MRVLGVDPGRRRIGLAISDPSGTLARPLMTITIAKGSGADELLREVVRLAAEDEGLAAIVVGVPVRLDGSDNDETPRALALVAALRTHGGVPVHEEDERLTSHEADGRLADTERNWRKRKARLDAAAAAVILQDYLDRHKDEGAAPR